MHLLLQSRLKAFCGRIDLGSFLGNTVTEFGNIGPDEQTSALGQIKNTFV